MFGKKQILQAYLLGLRCVDSDTLEEALCWGELMYVRGEDVFFYVLKSTENNKWMKGTIFNDF